MKKVLTIKELGVMLCATEELIFAFEQDLKEKEDSYKLKYLKELQDAHTKANHLINYMNDEDEDSTLIDIDYEEEDKFCLFIKD